MVVDEARREDGRPPLGGTLGSSLLAMGPSGPVLLMEGEVPTAREVLESKASKPALPSGSSSSGWMSDPLLEDDAGDMME